MGAGSTRTRLVFLATALLGAAQDARADPQPAEQRNVVVVYQFEPGLPATVAVARGIRAALDEAGVLLHEEYLDQSRFEDPDAARDLSRWLAAKYAGRRVDAVVAVGGETLRFLLDASETLWPGIPLVVCGWFADADELGALPPRVTGIRAHLPLAENLALVDRLRPGARRLVLLAGTSRVDRAYARLFWKAAREFGHRFEITDLSGLTYEEMRDRLAALPEDTVAFATTVLRDGGGRHLTGPNILHLLAPRSAVPIFAPFDTVLGHGIVGGWLVSFDKIGREAGVVTSRILAGEAPAAIPIARSDSVRLAFDARELERWSIARALLPQGAEVVFNRPPSPFQRPRVVAGLAIVLLLQAALIGTLLVERRRRVRLEREARENRARIAHMNRVAVVGELTATLAHEVSTPLAAIINDARAARRFLDGQPRVADARASIAAVEQQGQRAREVLLHMRRALRRENDLPARVDLATAVRDALRLVETDAREHGVALESEVGPAPTVACDAVALQQVLLNLLVNAIEAVREQPSDRRRVRVSVRATGDAAEVLVRDWGRGIALESRPALFQAFYTTKRDGLGMGLSICRTIVEEHGGRIAMEPHEQGVAFRFELPLAAAVAAPALGVS